MLGKALLIQRFCNLSEIAIECGRSALTVAENNQPVI